MFFVRVGGIGPPSHPWQGRVLPLNHTRFRSLCEFRLANHFETQENKSYFILNYCAGGGPLGPFIYGSPTGPRNVEPVGASLLRTEKIMGQIMIAIKIAKITTVLNQKLLSMLFKFNRKTQPIQYSVPNISSPCH